MPRYIEVVSAASETAGKVLALRAGTTRRARQIKVTTEGGRTASVLWSDDRSSVCLNMPSLPPDAVLTRAEADRLVAFLIHECCHVLHSSRNAWRHAVASGARVKIWTNALEDVRIEAREIKVGTFPAMRSLLSGMTNHLHFESVMAARKSGRTIGAKVADAPYVACILGRLANGYTIPAAAGLAGGMSDKVAQLMAVALPGIRGCRSTEAVLQLAQQLVAMEEAMKPPPREPEQEQDEPEQDEQDEPEDGENEPNEDEPEDGEDEPEDGEDEPEDGENEPNEDEPADEPGQDGEPDDDGESIPTDANLSETVDKIAERAGIDDLDHHVGIDGSHALSTLKSTIETADNGFADTATNSTAARQLSERLPRNAVLHNQIGRLLVSDEVHRVTHRETAGRLDRRALVRMRAGATDVFSQRDEQPGIETALLILIDGSSSMAHRNTEGASTMREVLARPTRMMLAQTAAWHIARAAESADAKVAVAVFLTPYDQYGMPQPGADVRIIKPWDVSVADRAAVLAAVTEAGATPMSPAIIAVAPMLADVPATRHILLVLTDGECQYGASAVTRACTIAGDYGVETVGVGMDCASVTDAFPPRYSVNVADLAQLAQAGLGVLVQMLEDANPRGAD